VNSKNLNGRVSAALTDGRFEDALQLLKELKKGGQVLRLGTVQRWVRDIDINTLNPDRIKIRVMDLVLRCTEEFKNFAAEGADAEDLGRGLVFFKDEFAPCDSIKNLKTDWRNTGLYDQKEDCKVVKYEKAKERFPPNFYDLSIWTNVKDISLEDSKKTPIKRIDVPEVPGAFVLTNVLSEMDCNKLRNMVETMGFDLDIPIGQSTETGHDSRAKGCVWVVNPNLHDQLFERCKDHLP
jgi:hypothetical protein